MGRVRRTFEKAARFFHLESWFRLLLLCVLVGLVSGLGAFGFDRALRFLQNLLLQNWLFDKGSPTQYIALIAGPAIGGALVGALGLWLAPEATGHGTDSVIRAFHRN